MITETSGLEHVATIKAVADKIVAVCVHVDCVVAIPHINPNNVCVSTLIVLSL